MEVEREEWMQWCLCVFVGVSGLVGSLSIFLPAKRCDPTELTNTHTSRWSRPRPSGWYLWVCVHEWLLHECVLLRETVTWRHTPMHSECIIKESISRLSWQLINETTPFGWPSLSLSLALCASKLLPLFHGYERVVILWMLKVPQTTPLDYN